MPVELKKEKQKVKVEQNQPEKWLCKTHDLMITKGFVCYECKEGRRWHEFKELKKNY